MSSAFAVTADVDLIPPVRTEADLVSAFAITALIGFEKSAQAQLISNADLQADVTLIPPVRIEANLTTAFTVTASIQGSFDIAANLTGEFTESVDGQRLRRPSVNLISAANLAANAGRSVGYAANLPVVASTLTVGSLIHIDPFYQYKVEPESRRGTVLPESRVFLVESETRVNMIL